MILVYNTTLRYENGIKVILVRSFKVAQNSSQHIPRLRF